MHGDTINCEVIVVRLSPVSKWFISILWCCEEHAIIFGPFDSEETAKRMIRPADSVERVFDLVDDAYEWRTAMAMH